MFGDNVKKLSLTDSSKSDEVTVYFPGGSISVGRRSDGEGYWAHINVDRELNETPNGTVTAGRIDCKSKSINAQNLGDLLAPDFYHVAVCVKVVKVDGAA